MSINLLQHKEDLLKAYNAVVDPKNEINWALYTYDGNSNTLKLLDTGDGGVDELVNSFNSGKVMYALCQVIEPTTGLPKLMLIHWQGEGVGTTRLGSCANHIYEVQKFFKGIHLTHNARNEDDVEPDVIVSAIKKVSYGAKIAPLNVAGQNEPSYVGSVYQRVNPGRDINTSERDKFWSMAEKEETVRLEEEKRRITADKQRVDDEKRRLQERLTDECQKDISETKRKSIPTSESLRKERLQEVKEVVKPTSNLKAMWEQKTNIPPVEPPKSPVDDVVVRPVIKKAWPPMPSRESFEQPDDQRLSFENGSRKSPMSPKSMSPTIQSPVKEEPEPEKKVQNGSHNGVAHSAYQKNVKDTVIEAPFKASLPPRMPDSDEEQEPEQDWESPPLEDEPVVPAAPISPRRSTTERDSNLGQQAKALWDYAAGDETEITFDPGDIITHIEFIDEGWWRGRGPDGKFGLFPANYVELFE